MPVLLHCVIRPAAAVIRAVRPRPPADPAVLAAAAARRASGAATAARRAAILVCTAAPGAMLALGDDTLPYPPPAPPGEPAQHADAPAPLLLPMLASGASLFGSTAMAGFAGGGFGGPGSGGLPGGGPGGDTPGGGWPDGDGGELGGGEPSVVSEPSLGALVLALGLLGAFAWRRRNTAFRRLHASPAAPDGARAGAEARLTPW